MRRRSRIRTNVRSHAAAPVVTVRATSVLATAYHSVRNGSGTHGRAKQAVVVGALGVIGRYIVERLLGQGDWSVIGLSRRTAEAAPRYHHIAVDLLDATDVAAKLAGLTEATHVFYAAFQARGRRRRGLCIEHRAEPRHAGQRRHGDRPGVACAAPRGAGHRHEILRLASRAVQDAGARGRSAPHRRPTIISTRSTGSPPSSAASAGTSWSCGRRPCAALRPARR